MTRLTPNLNLIAATPLRLIALAAVASGLLFALAACGQVERRAEVVIESDDQMNFDKDEFTVRAGQTVKLTLKHVGEMSLEQMGHNVAILEPGEDPVSFGQEVQQQGGNRENEWLPEPMRDRVIAFTRMLGGGETDTIEFTAPEEPGRYPFLCTFPGHFGMMNGYMIVR